MAARDIASKPDMYSAAASRSPAGAATSTRRTLSCCGEGLPISRGGIWCPHGRQPSAPGDWKVSDALEASRAARRTSSGRIASGQSACSLGVGGRFGSVWIFLRNGEAANVVDVLRFVVHVQVAIRIDDKHLP